MHRDYDGSPAVLPPQDSISAEKPGDRVPEMHKLTGGGAGERLRLYRQGQRGLEGGDSPDFNKTNIKKKEKV
jgi:hypothetical protein